MDAVTIRSNMSYDDCNRTALDLFDDGGRHSGIDKHIRISDYAVSAESTSSSGRFAFSTVSRFTTTRLTPFREGMSYMTSIIMFSTIDLSPLAPVFWLIDFSAIASIASSLNSRSTLSILREAAYCLMMEFFGSVIIR